MRSRHITLTCWLCVLAGLLAMALAAAPAAAQTIAITGGRVFPVSGPPIENGTVVIENGKLTAVGASARIPAGATVVDAKGKWVTPGLVNAATALGLVEIGAVGDSNDARARGEHAVAAAFRAWEALNPASVLWAPAVNEGITTVAVLPGGAFVAGQAAVVDTARAAGGAMVRRAPVAMVVNLQSAAAAEAGSRAEMMGRLRELLADARAYAARKEEFERGNTRAFSTGREQLEGLGLVVDGTVPLLVAVDRASDIEAVLGLGADFKLKIMILGGAEAWMVADKLAAAKVPVLTGALDNIPTSFATLGARQENAALLSKAGVAVAVIAGEGETFNVRNVRQHAGNAVAYGMPWDEALRAVTLTPAELVGVEGAIGSLQAGRDANVVVWDGDPLELTTNAVHVFIGGRSAKTTSRQDMLTERYKPRR